MLLDDPATHAEAPQCNRHRQTNRPGTHDQDIGLGVIGHAQNISSTLRATRRRDPARHTPSSLPRVHYLWTGELFEWRGPSPFYFISMSPTDSQDLREIANEVTYGWGVIPVRVRIGNTEWTTSLFPREGNYLVPVKDKVRRAEAITLGDRVAVQMWIEQRHGKPAG